MAISPNSSVSTKRYFNAYVDNAGWLRLLYRDGEKVFEEVTRARWSTYFRKDALGNHRHELERTPKAVRVETEGDWLRVDWKDRWVREMVLLTQDKTGNPIPNWFQSNDIRPHESTVSPIRRYFVDNPLAQTDPSPRIAYLDIETDSRLPFTRKAEMRVLCCAIVAGCATASLAKGDHVALVLEEDSDDAERRELCSILEALEEFDCIAAWYGDGFDFVVIKERCKALNLEVNWKRWTFVDHLEVFRMLNAHVAESGEEKQSMALNNVANAVLGEGKHDFDASKSWEAWEANGQSRRTLVNYCIQDTELLLKIEERTGYLSLFGTICGACQLFMETHSLKTTAQMDGFMLRLGKEHNHHYPDKFGEPVVQRYEGAFVLHPTCTGIQRDVHVADFSALYPSIIITWNMSPETLNDECPTTGSIPKDTCRAPNTGIGFWTHTKGLLPIALETLIKMRKHHNERKASLPPGTPEWDDADRWSTAYKVLANSFYGGLGSIYSRYYVRRIAESVSTTGAWLIKQTIAEAEKAGFEVLYTDTDSAFVKGQGSELGTPGYEKFSAFVSQCNERVYPKLVKSLGCKDNRINLAYEKAFKRLVMTAAKKYVGTYAHYKGKPATAESKPEVKGMEFKRGDSVRVARQLQKEVIDLFCSGEESPVAYESIVERWKTRVLDEPLELDDAVISQAITKPIKDYVAKTPPSHVRVAKTLKERGEDVSVGTKIAYFVVEGGKGAASSKPAKDWDGECDRFFLWEKRTYPPTLRFLQAAFPEFPWNRHSKVRPKNGEYGALPLPGLGGGKVAPRPISVVPSPDLSNAPPKPLLSQTNGVVSVVGTPKIKSTTTRVAVSIDAKGRAEDDEELHALVPKLGEYLDTLGNGSTSFDLTVQTDTGEVLLSLPRKVLIKRSTIRTLNSLLKPHGIARLITA